MSACNWASRNSDSWKLLLNPCTKTKALCFFRRVSPCGATALRKSASLITAWSTTAKLLRGSGVAVGISTLPDLWLGGTETTNFAKLSALAEFAVNTFPDEISRSRVVATYICSVFSPDEAATGVSTSGPGLAAQPTKMKENRTATALPSPRQRKLLHMGKDSPTKPARNDTIALGAPTDEATLRVSLANAALQ